MAGCMLCVRPCSRSCAPLKPSGNKNPKGSPLRSFRVSGPQIAETAVLRVDHRLQVLQRQRAHFLARGLGLECHLLAGEGIEAFTSLRGGFLAPRDSEMPFFQGFSVP